MQKVILIIAVVLFSTALFSQDGGLGLGIILGEPTGLSVKMWTNENSALDAAAAWSFAGTGWIHVHADLLQHNFELINVNKGTLPLYYGLGAYLGLASDLRMGARVPIGLAYLFYGAPVDAFAEVVPGLALLPKINFKLAGAIGIRYFF